MSVHARIRWASPPHARLPRIKGNPAPGQSGMVDLNKKKIKLHQKIGTHKLRNIRPSSFRQKDSQATRLEVPPARWTQLRPDRSVVCHVRLVNCTRRYPARPVQQSLPVQEVCVLWLVTLWQCASYYLLFSLAWLSLLSSATVPVDS